MCIRDRLRLSGSEYRFSSPQNSVAVYDAFFEIMPEALCSLAPEFKQFQFDVDQFGTKAQAQLQSEFVITCKDRASSQMNFSLCRKPLALNLLYPSENDHDTFALCRRTDIRGDRRLKISTPNEVQYFVGNLDTKTLFRSILKRKLLRK